MTPSPIIFLSSISTCTFRELSTAAHHFPCKDNKFRQGSRVICIDHMNIFSSVHKFVFSHAHPCIDIPMFLKFYPYPKNLLCQLPFTGRDEAHYVNEVVVSVCHYATGCYFECLINYCNH